MASTSPVSLRPPSAPAASSPPTPSSTSASATTTPTSDGSPPTTCPESTFLLSFGRAGFEGRGFEVGVEGSAPVEALVGSDGVELVAEVGDVICEVDAGGDVVAVEPLVFQ